MSAERFGALLVGRHRYPPGAHPRSASIDIFAPAEKPTARGRPSVGADHPAADRLSAAAPMHSATVAVTYRQERAATASTAKVE